MHEVIWKKNEKKHFRPTFFPPCSLSFHAHDVISKDREYMKDAVRESDERRIELPSKHARNDRTDTDLPAAYAFAMISPSWNAFEMLETYSQWNTRSDVGIELHIAENACLTGPSSIRIHRPWRRKLRPLANLQGSLHLGAKLSVCPNQISFTRDAAIPSLHCLATSNSWRISRRIDRKEETAGKERCQCKEVEA